RMAREQVARLAELSADDVASAAAHRLAVAEALLNLGTSPPAAALGATGTADAARVRRLIEGPAALSKARAAAVTSTLTVKVMLSAGPRRLAATAAAERPAGLAGPAHHLSCIGDG